MELFIENKQDKIPYTSDIKELITQVIQKSLETENFELNCEISVLLVDNEQIRELNNKYRNINRETDVLSFPMADVYEGEVQNSEQDYDMDGDMLMLGDIVISLEMVLKQSEEYNHSFERELAFLASHGAFHLMGYDHENEEDENKMMEKQEKVLNLLDLRREKN